ncbi:hypothetical protein Intca_1453 [Intrasporangium calvum DSM 43043]|uniref:Uncharacterized protein n=2 Tax=Intrasporangium calvum TaxID=53358 RepID=E6S7R1_INTC7|nr:hypothetical protein Intca_1453 [Intrasporangium calvum DSM 43043]
MRPGSLEPVGNSARTGSIRASMMVMSFKDLPQGGARDLDLSDHTYAADVIDLITLEEDRALGCFSAMLCDSEDHGVQPLCLKCVEPGASPDEMVDLLELVLPLLAQSRGSILLARGRVGALRPTDDDRHWHQRAIEVCRAHGVKLLGFHIATHDGVLRLPEPLAASDVA